MASINEKVTEIWSNLSEVSDVESLISVGNRIADALERLAESAESPQVAQQVQQGRIEPGPDRTVGFRLRVTNARRAHPEESLAESINRVRQEMHTEQEYEIRQLVQMEQGLREPMGTYNDVMRVTYPMRFFDPNPRYQTRITGLEVPAEPPRQGTPNTVWQVETVADTPAERARRGQLEAGRPDEAPPPGMTPGQEGQWRMERARREATQQRPEHDPPRIPDMPF